MNRNSTKSGLSVIECVVALSVLAVMLSVVLSIQVVQSVRISLTKQKLVAEQTLSNLAQRIVSADESEINETSISQWAQQWEQSQGLPQDTIHIKLKAVSEPAEGKRIVLTWKPPSSHLPAYSLVTWRFVKETKEVAEERP